MIKLFKIAAFCGLLFVATAYAVGVYNIANLDVQAATCATLDCRQEQAQQDLRAMFIRDVQNPRTAWQARALMLRCGAESTDPEVILECYTR